MAKQKKKSKTRRRRKTKAKAKKESQSLDFLSAESIKKKYKIVDVSYSNKINKGRLNEIPGTVLVNMIPKKYLFLPLKLYLAKAYPPIVPTITAIIVLVMEIVNELIR